MPYIRLFRDREQIGQLSMAEARNFARDIEAMCARTEADAMILKFFDEQQLPEGAAAAIMIAFRTFRHALDSEPVIRTVSDPDTDEPAGPPQ